MGVIELTAEGATITLFVSKTTQAGAAAVHIYILPGLALKALKRWIEIGGILEGTPVFRAVNRGGRIGTGRMTDGSIARLVKVRCAAAGLDSKAFSGHSLRAGMVTSAAESGVPEWRIRLTSRHKSDVTAAQDAVAAAERIRAAECGNGDAKQRGPNCRARESEEQTKRTALAAAVASKTATDKAAKLETQAEAIRARLDRAPPVANPNPLGAALEQIVGGAAAFLTAWQQAVVAAVFELCLVGVMVIYELLGQRKAATSFGRPATEATSTPAHEPEAQSTANQAAPAAASRKANTRGRKSVRKSLSVDSSKRKRPSM
jgi:hypothetical protein